MMPAPKPDLCRLSGLLGDLAKLASAQDPAITGLALDSRQIVPGDCFVALNGARESGARFASMAEAAGASAVLIENAQILPRLRVPVVGVTGLRQHLGEIAARFFGHPSRTMTVTAVTGTNGKTTVAHLCAQALERIHGQCAYFGTLGFGRLDALKTSPNTTPDPIVLQRTMAELLTEDCRHVSLEASSHALDQGRLNGTEIGIAIFTGLGHDHLDYHGTLEAYGEAKLRLFRYPSLHTAVVNADDPYADQVLKATGPGVRLLRFSSNPQAGPVEIQAVEVHSSGAGSEIKVRTPFGPVEIESPLIGAFNVQNLLAALGALLASGIAPSVAGAALSAAVPVRGRMERIVGGPDAPLVYVDYAHTPDSLERALATLRRLTSGQLVCVFGCGGDRDRSKRPLMGEIAERDADRVIITSDNPRGEDAALIAAEILGGLRQPKAAQVLLDRAAAIEAALRFSGPGDAVLIAGKGHESTQSIGEKVLPFDDAETVRRIFAGSIHD